MEHCFNLLLVDSKKTKKTPKNTKKYIVYVHRGGLDSFYLQEGKKKILKAWSFLHHQRKKTPSLKP